MKKPLPRSTGQMHFYIFGQSGKPLHSRRDLGSRSVHKSDLIAEPLLRSAELAGTFRPTYL